MIRATGRMGDGRPLLILGVTDATVSGLTAGVPITVDLEDVGLAPGVLFVLHGSSESSIVEDLAARGLVAGAP